MDGRDRRQFPRFEGNFQVDVLNMGDDHDIPAWNPVVDARALDVSKHGMRVRTSYSVNPGSLMSMITYYKDRESICLCEVVWRREVEGENLYGLYIKQWSRLDPQLEKQLDLMETQEKKEKAKEMNKSSHYPLGGAPVTA